MHRSTQQASSSVPLHDTLPHMHSPSTHSGPV
jgi:hypothetical protein